MADLDAGLYRKRTDRETRLSADESSSIANDTFLRGLTAVASSSYEVTGIVDPSRFSRLSCEGDVSSDAGVAVDTNGRRVKMLLRNDISFVTVTTKGADDACESEIEAALAGVLGCSEAGPFIVKVGTDDACEYPDGAQLLCVAGSSNGPDVRYV